MSAVSILSRHAGPAPLKPSHEFEQVPQPHLLLKGEAAERHRYRESVTWFKKPHMVIIYFVIVVVEWLFHTIQTRKVALLMAGLFAFARYQLLAEQETYKIIESMASSVLLWVLLGFLSSFGMGFGLHTFVLFLAPAIFHVAAETDSFWATLEKVWWWSFSWGAGTAIGELPPYFTARAARISGKQLEDLDDYEGVKHEDVSLFGRAKNFVIANLEHFGFIHIMLFASVPNPLFDLAGLACGYTLKPFHVFFGATFVGKAVFKSSFQTLFVIATHHSIGPVADYLDSLDFLKIWVWSSSIVAYLLPADCTSFLKSLEYFRKYYKDNNPGEISFHSLGKVFSKAEQPGIRDVLILAILGIFVLNMIQNVVQAHLAEKEEQLIKRNKN